MGWLQGVATEFGSLSPVKAMLAEAGGNIQTITICILIVAGATVTKKALEDDD